VWLKTEGRARDFYKGLIQAAVAFYHWSRGNPGGAMSLYRSSGRYLRKYRPAYLGVDVEGFLAQYTQLFGWLRHHHLRYDSRLVPCLRWAKSATGSNNFSNE
jgi:predicted metal-dependent hydrolase